MGAHVTGGRIVMWQSVEVSSDCLNFLSEVVSQVINCERAGGSSVRV